MSENNTNTNDNSNSIIAQIEADLLKADKDSLKSKLKDLVKKRKDAEKVVTSINLEITKMISDFEKGLA
jgi:predicted transcriptional regulator